MLADGSLALGYDKSQPRGLDGFPLRPLHRQLYACQLRCQGTFRGQVVFVSRKQLHGRLTLLRAGELSRTHLRKAEGLGSSMLLLPLLLLGLGLAAQVQAKQGQHHLSPLREKGGLEEGAVKLRPTKGNNRGAAALVAASKSSGRRGGSEMLLVNSAMFGFYACLGSVMPFIPLYYSLALGASDEKVGWWGAINPSLTFLVSPLWGALADSTGLDKQIMLITFALSTATRCGLVRTQSFKAVSALVALTAVISAPVKPLLDAIVMSRLKDKTNFGKSRLWGQLGFGFGSWLAGPMLSSAKDIKKIFALQAVLAVPTVVLMLLFLRASPSSSSSPASAAATAKEKIREMRKIVGKSVNTVPESDFVSALRLAGSDRRLVAFFTLVFLLGISSGIIENFAYVGLKEARGYDGAALGVCRLVSSIAGVPMFYVSGDIVKRVGVDGVLLGCLIAYVARFLIYSSLTNTWQALPAEILRGLAFALFTSASTFYVYNAAPKFLLATMLSLLSGTYNGLGQSVGSLVGGALSKRIGIINVFKVCGVFDAVLATLFFSYMRHQRRKGGSGFTSK